MLGEGGPITVPPNTEVSIGDDGTVSAIPTDSIPNTVNIVGRIRLVNPPERDLVRGDDGLFRLRSGGPAPAGSEREADQRRAGRQQREHGARRWST